MSAFSGHFETFLSLGNVILIASTPSSDDVHESLKQQNLSGRLLLQEQQQVSSLCNAQLGKTMLFVPKDYQELNCGTCRDLGCSTLTWPYLDGTREVSFAYGYFLHQVESYLHVGSFLHGQIRD